MSRAEGVRIRRLGSVIAGKAMSIRSQRRALFLHSLNKKCANTSQIAYVNR